jgi:hypothetical protein
MYFLALFAQQPQQKPAGSPFDRPELIWGSVGLAAALFIGAVVIYLVDKWRRQTAMEDKESGLELSDFRAMLESGQISKEEYERLRLKVANRVKKSETAPAAPVVPPPATNPPVNPPPVPGPFPPEYFDDPPKLALSPPEARIWTRIHSPSSSSLRGSLTVKAEPFPTTLSTRMRPWCCSMI